VAWHLEGAGIRSVLVGGAVVSIYTEGLYRSGDLDLVPDDLGRTRLGPVLREIGFEPTRSRYYKHPECPHLFLEFPRGPVEIGEEFPITPEEIVVGGRRPDAAAALSNRQRERPARRLHSLAVPSELRPSSIDLPATARAGGPTGR
jgi:hypothetical protein